jgi:hypothetical protein
MIRDVVELTKPRTHWASLYSTSAFASAGHRPLTGEKLQARVRIQ